MSTTVLPGVVSRLDWDGVRRPLDAAPLPVLSARSTNEHTVARRVATVTASVAGTVAGEWVVLHEGGVLLAAVFAGAGAGLAAVFAVVYVISHRFVDAHAREARQMPIPKEYL